MRTNEGMSETGTVEDLIGSGPGRVLGASGELILDRRGLDDRRRFSYRTLLSGIWYSRRRFSRREGDQDNTYVDWYESRLMYLAIGVFLLSCADAVLTLNLLSLGSVEINPVMAALIEKDTQLFVNSKLALTGTGLVILVAHFNFRLFRTLKIGHLLSVLLVLYIALTSYELAMLAYILT